MYLNKTITINGLIQQYQHDIIFALLLFCSESSHKNKLFEQKSVVLLHMRLPNFKGTLYDVLVKRDIMFCDIK